jgi:hypothetical protein
MLCVILSAGSPSATAQQQQVMAAAASGAAAGCIATAAAPLFVPRLRWVSSFFGILLLLDEGTCCSGSWFQVRVLDRLRVLCPARMLPVLLHVT